MKLRRELLESAVIMILFLFIALFSISFIFAPAVAHTQIEGTETVMAPSALTVDGLGLRAKVWKEYPDYIKGFGVMAGIGFAGAIYSCYVLFSIYEAGHETL